MVEPARYVAYGAFGYLYSGDHSYLALPLPAVLLAPAERLSEHWNLLDGYPLPVPKATSWLVIGPWELLATIPALRAVRRLAHSLGVRGGSRLVVVQLWFTLVVLLPCSTWAHPEDVLACAFLLWSLAAQREGREGWCWIWLALAVCSKQWALVAVPFVLVATPPGRRRRAVLAILVPPVLLAALPLAVDWPDASAALLFPDFPRHLADGHYSVLLPLVESIAGPHGSVLGRALELLAAPAVAVALRHRPEPVRLVGLGAVLLLRLFSEPVVFAYYAAPALALLTLACLAARPQLPLRLMFWQFVLTLWLLPDSPHPAWWWTGAVVILVTGANAFHRAFAASGPEEVPAGVPRTVGVPVAVALPGTG
jgi:hypothetical protein